ncbi:glucokinase [Pseudooceanicola sp. HF7]|uniref:glucokinase n=1 Tax=Pseudooceanicola sp. HF7 TaxID=2721560 RepID=UPI0014315C21|nr:glucokinase [Pseudooceanicola sp. HF7]NIZ10005.1 glucokinase [Pseudooceanicola sp. HF7]
MKLVSDVGGTNVRFALAKDGHILAETIRSFRNDDYAAFLDAATRYVAEAGSPALETMAVAVAGPVNGTRARLTNRDWSFDTAVLDSTFGVTSRLINDLEALGYSVPSLTDDGLLQITTDFAGKGDQAVVAGIGTGFNVSPVVMKPEGPMVPKAEMGHVQLAWRARAKVSELAGTEDHGYDTVEHLYSGRGFEKLWRLWSGSPLGAAEAMAAEDPAMQGFLNHYGSLMAWLAQDLTLAFLPGQGVYFSGGVARAVLTKGGAAAFCAAYGEPLALDTASHVPVRVILDDTAALAGCAAA